MNCLEREQLFDYAHGMLEPPKRDTVYAHLADCAHCRAVVEEYRKLDAVLDEWRPAEPSPWFDARVRAAIAVEGEGGFSRALGALQWGRWLVPAAVLALMVLAFVVAQQSRRAPQPVARQETSPSIQPMPEPPPTVRQETAQAGPAGRGPHTQSVNVAKSSGPLAAQTQPARTATEEDELSLYQNLPVLEDYDLLANFDVLSELPVGGKKAAN